MAAKSSHLYMSDLPVNMRSRRTSSLSSSIIPCVKKWSLMCFRNLLGCLPSLIVLPSGIRVAEHLDVQSRGFWMSKESLIYFLFLIRQSLACLPQYHLCWSVSWFLVMRFQLVLHLVQGKAPCTLATSLHRI